MRYDTIVIGLGGMGSATAYQLAARGQRVLGLEQFSAAHTLGSSHGHTRIIRQAYLEGAAYVPLVQHAYDRWRALERDSGEQLLIVTGGLMLGPEGSDTISGSRTSAELYDIPHELLDAPEIRRRFPQFRPDDSTVGLYEPSAGAVRPEAGILAHLRLAEQHGATLQFDAPVRAWQADAAGAGVRVTTDRGVYEADTLAITAGAWAPALLRDLGVPLIVERQVQLWFEPTESIAAFGPGRFPIFIWENDADTHFYGIPALDPALGVKAAIHHGGAMVQADMIDRTVQPDDVARVRALVRQRIPALDGRVIDGAVCMYTNTPDEHFVIAAHPAYRQVVVAGGFSGHGYKFAPVVGEILADLAIDGATQHPIALFAPDRFGAAID